MYARHEIDCQLYTQYQRDSRQIEHVITCFCNGFIND